MFNNPFTDKVIKQLSETLLDASVKVRKFNERRKAEVNVTAEVKETSDDKKEDSLNGTF